MAIARLLKAEIVCAKGDDSSLISELENARLVQVEDMHAGLQSEYAEIEQEPVLDVQEEEAAFSKAKFVLDTFGAYEPVEKGLLENFFGSPPFIEEPAFADILGKLDIGAYEERVRKTIFEIDAVSGEIDRLSGLEKTLAPWTGLREKLSSIAHMKHVTPFPVVGSPLAVSALVEHASEAGEDIQWVEVERSEKRISGILFVTPQRASDADEWLAAAALERLKLPDLEESPEEALTRVRAELASLRAKKDGLEESMRAEAREKRPLVQAVFDEYSNRKKNTLIRKRIYYTKNVFVVRGWILERDRDGLEKLISDRLPGSEISFSLPEKTDSPPVKLENPKVLQPFQILLEMFGLPTYFGIDPTWFVGLAMTLFYSICLGDAGYGTCQILLTLWLVRKFKPAEGTRLFLRLFTEMGVGTALFGILTWSFFGFSPGYTAGGPKILGFLPILSPTKDILTIIGVAAAIGAIFQLGSILLGFYASLKSGDKAGAYFDKLAWFFFLTGIIMWVGMQFLPGSPGALKTLSLVVAGTSGAVIFLFAGRSSKGIVGRLFTGLISFYGIVGYYGAVSFFGDVLSYLRLAILNLTGGFIAFVANVIGELLMGKGSVIIVALTLLIALVPMLLFHVLNLILSMLGAFVHSLRLNYLESFTRYYGSGGKVFAPLKKEGRYYRFEE